jgi:hypothetical protein
MGGRAAIENGKLKVENDKYSTKNFFISNNFIENFKLKTKDNPVPLIFNFPFSIFNSF